MTQYLIFTFKNMKKIKLKFDIGWQCGPKRILMHV